MKGHTSYRAFHFQKFNSNCELFYKSSSLAQFWLGFEGSISNEILLFSQISPFDEIPSHEPFKPLNLTIIDTIFNIDTITQHLDSFYKKWYLKLFSRNQ